MANYIYTVVDNAGHTKTQTIESANEEALVARLQNEGYFVVSVRLAKENVVVSKMDTKNTALKFARNKCKTEDLVVFSRQLATMLGAGVPMLRSMDVILSQIQSRDLYMAVKQTHDQIEQGASLSAALGKHPRIFNQFWVSLMEVGESSGTMPLVLNKLAEHVERDAAFESAIISAMIYPMILCVVSVGALIFFAMVVAPKFEDVFHSMHAELPVLTRLLLALFDFIKHYILLIAGVCFVFFIFVKAYISTPVGKLQFEQVIYGLPVVGEVTKLITIERFSAQMAILIESGVPILYALEITEKLVDNKTCALVIARVRAGVREGKGMADALQESPFFPIMAVQMIRVGEETGELGKMLNHVAKFYQDSVEAFMKRLGTLIEPFMLVFMAGMIGTIVVAIFLPLFKLGQGAQVH